MNSRSRWLRRALRCGVLALAPFTIAGAQTPPARVVLSEASSAECLCAVADRDADEARRCDGATPLERTASHASPSGLICSSLSLLDVEFADGRCELSSTSTTGSRCRDLAPRRCEVRYKLVFAVHSTACHRNAPNGFWIGTAPRPRLLVFRSEGTEIPFVLKLRPACGSCADAALTVSLPDGPSSGPGTALYRYMVAADCGVCAATVQTSGGAGSEPCER